MRIDGLNDHRADHQCHSFGHGTCVKWKYKGYEISLCMSGQDTRVFDPEDNIVFITSGTHIDSIMRAKDTIDYVVKRNKS